MRQTKLKMIVGLFLVILVVGCGRRRSRPTIQPPTAAPTAVADTATPKPQPTNTLLPKNTPLPAVTAPATATQLPPTATATIIPPTETPLPLPTATEPALAVVTAAPTAEPTVIIVAATQPPANPTPTLAVAPTTAAPTALPTSAPTSAPTVPTKTTLTVTEAELTAGVAQLAQEQNLPIGDDPAVRLQNGLITIEGEQIVFGRSLPLVVEVRVSAVNGQPLVEMERATTAGLDLPSGIQEQIRVAIEDGVASIMRSMECNFVESVTAENGTLVATCR